MAIIFLDGEDGPSRLDRASAQAIRNGFGSLILGGCSATSLCGGGDLALAAGSPVTPPSNIPIPGTGFEDAALPYDRRHEVAVDRNVLHCPRGSLFTLKCSSGQRRLFSIRNTPWKRIKEWNAMPPPLICVGCCLVLRCHFNDKIVTGRSSGVKYSV
ncbi:uncharacterized protein LOC104584788 [Brachypodium distachyon]|uniref:uncharacterized protein LOC104584788 n=1 Tax=Brachypodium distachyon TaxID=15368 RepID=UPI00071DBEC1|nr:uncharacterized protein LOC104584788 [Brachypodium distachyon]|eukprot:XP_014757912.1 uncharacterized protein LOC104584788 [Brachypodium distachyon]